MGCTIPIQYYPLWNDIVFYFRFSNRKFSGRHVFSILTPLGDTPVPWLVEYLIQTLLNEVLRYDVPPLEWNDTPPLQWSDAHLYNDNTRRGPSRMSQHVRGGGRGGRALVSHEGDRGHGYGIVVVEYCDKTNCLWFPHTARDGRMVAWKMSCAARRGQYRVSQRNIIDLYAGSN